MHGASIFDHALQCLQKLLTVVGLVDEVFDAGLLHPALDVLIDVTTRDNDTNIGIFPPYSFENVVTGDFRKAEI